MRRLSAHLLFAYGINRFSHDVAHNEKKKEKKKAQNDLARTSMNRLMFEVRNSTNEPGCKNISRRFRKCSFHSNLNWETNHIRPSFFNFLICEKIFKILESGGRNKNKIKIRIIVQSIKKIKINKSTNFLFLF